MTPRSGTPLHAGAVLVLFAAYAISAPRTLPEADAGELAAVAVAGGIPHPPGYPLLTLLLQAFAGARGLLGLTPALALSSMLFSCAAALLLARTLIARGHAPLHAWTATLAVFLSTHVWRAGTIFEPFALNHLLAAGVLASCQRLSTRREGEAGDTRDLRVLGALFGLGLCNHHSLALLAPLPLSWLIAEPGRLRARVWPLLAGFALGITPLAAFLWLREQPGWVWGDWHAFGARLVSHVGRAEYGTFRLSTHEPGSVWSGPTHALAVLPASLSYAFFALVVLGAARAARRAFQEPRTALDAHGLGLAASWLASALFFPALFHMPVTALDALIVERFFALHSLLLAFPLASALRWLSPQLRAAQAPACALLLLGHAAYQLPRADRARHRVFEAHVRNVFDTLPRGAVLVASGDTGFTAGLYGRYVLGRRDVAVVFPTMNQPWYLARVEAELGASTASGATAGRPLYALDDPRTEQGAIIPSYPIGPLLRALHPGEAVPPAAELFARNAALFAKLRLPSREQVVHADAWEATELTNYARTWERLRQALERAGDTALAARARAYRELFTP